MTKKLAVAISDLLRRAESQPGVKTSLRLSNGLSVDVKVETGRDERTHLQIHRTNVHPSRAEWNTILMRWPYPIKVEPREAIHQGRYYLMASWASQHRLHLPADDVCAQTQE